MEILIAGNLANHGYLLSKLLREEGVSVDLLLRKNPSKTEDPKSVDSLNEYPDWIKFWNGSRFDWKYQVIKKMRKYDLIHASTELPIFAYISHRPYIAFATGADVVKLANENSLKGFLLRRAYHNARVFIFGSPYQEKYVNRLKIKRTIFIPILWDHTKFNPSNKHKKNNERFIIFHPTNHLWYYKKNDRFMRAFVRIAKEYNNVYLIMINRGADFEKSIKVLGEDLLRDKVTILPETLPQSQLTDYYHNSDLVVDQFGVGSTGLIGQEVMACAKPLLQYIDVSTYEKFYSESPPILNAETEDQIYLAIQNLLNDTKLGVEIGKKAREWLLKYHDHSKIIQKYIYLYNAINDKENFNEIKETIRAM